MGLDMYLKAKRFAYKSQYEGEKDYPAIERDDLENAVVDIAVPAEFDKYGSRTFSCTAIYWRKVNAIHGWFVDNVQDGNDDCGSYYVSIEKLSALLDVISLALNDPKNASEYLPVRDGFFFGSPAYDDYYFDDLRWTQVRLAQILSMPELDKWSFYYESSW